MLAKLEIPVEEGAGFEPYHALLAKPNDTLKVISRQLEGLLTRGDMAAAHVRLLRGFPVL